MKTREKLINTIIEYFENNEDTFIKCIEELDGWNGYLNDDRYYDMDMLNEFYGNTEPIELLYRCFYGHDADNYTTDASGNRTYGEFNPNRNYFNYNGYGNLVSTNYIDYSDKLDNYFIESLYDNRQYLHCIDANEELTTLFNELENMED
jgi:hypothetical protein